MSRMSFSWWVRILRGLGWLNELGSWIT